MPITLQCVVTIPPNPLVIMPQLAVHGKELVEHSLNALTTFQELLHAQPSPEPHKHVLPTPLEQPVSMPLPPQQLVPVSPPKPLVHIQAPPHALGELLVLT